jgi:hypothetical protein
MSQAEARAFIRKIMGPERRVYTGAEREHVLTMLALCEPVETSNNQRTLTEVYKVGAAVYHVTYGFGGDDDPLVEELLADDNA